MTGCVTFLSPYISHDDSILFSVLLVIGLWFDYLSSLLSVITEF